jgi:hypothetical protein
MYIYNFLCLFCHTGAELVMGWFTIKAVLANAYKENLQIHKVGTLGHTREVKEAETLLIFSFVFASATISSWKPFSRTWGWKLGSLLQFRASKKSRRRWNSSEGSSTVKKYYQSKHFIAYKGWPYTITVKKIFNSKPLTKRSQGRPKYRWEDNIK